MRGAAEEDKAMALEDAARAAQAEKSALMAAAAEEREQAAEAALDAQREALQAAAIAAGVHLLSDSTCFEIWHGPDCCGCCDRPCSDCCGRLCSDCCSRAAESSGTARKV